MVQRRIGWALFWIVLLGATAVYLRGQVSERKDFLPNPVEYARNILATTRDTAPREESLSLEAESAKPDRSADDPSTGWASVATGAYSQGKALYTKRVGARLDWATRIPAGNFDAAVEVYAYPEGGENAVELTIGEQAFPLRWKAQSPEGKISLLASVQLKQEAGGVGVRVTGVGQTYVVVDRVRLLKPLDAGSLARASGAELIGRYCKSIGAVLLLLVAGVCWGSLLKRKVMADGGDAFASLVLSAGLGLGVIGTAVTLLGIAGWFRGPVVWGLLVAGILAGHRTVIRWVLEWRKRTRLGRDAGFTGAVIGIGIVAAFATVAALAPAVGVDPLINHLSIAKRLALEGRFEYHPMQLAWGFPHLVSNLYAVGLLIFDDAGFRSAVLVHAMLGMLWIVSVYVLGACMFGRAAGLGAVVLCLGVEGVSYEFGLGLADFGMAFFTTCAVLAFVWWWRSERMERGLIVGAAVLAGFAAVCKVNGPTTAIVLGICAGLAGWRRAGLRSGALSLLIVGVVSFAVAAPMYIKNILLYGNPIFPFGTFFPNQDLHANFGPIFANGDWPEYIRRKGPAFVVTWVYDWLRKGGSPDWFSPGPGFVCAFLLVLVSGRRWARAWWPVYVFTIGFVVLWMAISPLTRFGWPWLGIAFVFACAPLSERPLCRRRAAASVLMIAVALLPMLGELWRPLATWNVVCGNSDEAGYLARMEDYHAGTGAGPPLEGIRRMNALYRAAPWEGRTLIDTNMVAYADFPTIPSTYYLIVQGVEGGAWARGGSFPGLSMAGKRVGDEEMFRELRDRLKVDRILFKKGAARPVPGSDGRYRFGDASTVSYGEEDRFEVFIERWVREGRATRVEFPDSILYVLGESKGRRSAE